MNRTEKLTQLEDKDTEGILIGIINAFMIGFLLLSMNIMACRPAHGGQTTASWYSYESCIKEGTSGRFTASGEVFNHNDLTAAMWDVAFGTVVKVTNERTGKSVVVRINDRGPSKKLVAKGRVIDLSKAAFAKIADLKEGVIPVRLEVMTNG